MKTGIVSVVTILSPRFLLFCACLVTVCDSLSPYYNYEDSAQNQRVSFPQERYGNNRQLPSRYGPFAPPTRPNSFRNQYQRYFMNNNRRYDSGSDEIGTSLFPTQRNQVTPSPQREQQRTKNLVPDDCINEECCKPKQKWDPALQTCLKTMKMPFRRRSIA